MSIITKIKPSDISRGVIDTGLGAWSHSKLKMLHKCPFQFYLKYLVKAKEEVTAPPNLITEVGKAAHSILEKCVLGKPIEECFKLTRSEYKNVITEEEWEEQVSTLEYNIQKFQDRIDAFSVHTLIKRALQELRIGMTKDLQPTGFFAEDVWFRGVIDLALQLEGSKDVIYIDHKTGAPAISGLKNYKGQLNTYKILFHFGIEKTSGAQAGIHFIRDGELYLDDYVDHKTIEGELVNSLLYDIECAIEKTKGLGFFKHIAGPHCEWCDFKTSCKAKELVELEKNTKNLF